MALATPLMGTNPATMGSLPRVAVLVDRGAARAVAGDGDALGVAAEVVDVVAHPLDGEALVEQAQVVLAVEGRPKTLRR